MSATTGDVNFAVLSPEWIGTERSGAFSTVSSLTFGTSAAKSGGGASGEASAPAETVSVSGSRSSTSTGGASRCATTSGTVSRRTVSGGGADSLTLMGGRALVLASAPETWVITCGFMKNMSAAWNTTETSSANPTNSPRPVLSSVIHSPLDVRQGSSSPRRRARAPGTG